ncbi:MAG: putative 2-aminoethylphosphonate ABC transporter permease subunit [Rhodospirillaceae bacterium]|jgi:iron(III) transport system permease protein|nr:putative 2-aminoethylphosphonate ABC transporter permease subunit [Rhodospirillaceae bacterium]MBT5244712.1 putative 2-aminoethylphosphonate ABC transporter permease subunit [Rhodospirillaceae bacterium]MBT5562453.1 putative 2-aminoethylphosphonate ABC transporter permease subunit [Rhodospirillaceae bacterium]MBT6242091.1 putative 2-aminoethylphosphonate ABC transporter permease subunit [Rhodospirillaceae bacterium]
MSDVALASIAAIKPKLSRDDRIMRGFIVMVGVWMVVAVLLPLYFMLSKSTENHDGDFIGLANFQEYFSTPALFYSIENSFFIAIVSTLITITLAFQFAYALTRSTMWGKGFFKTIALIPILAPSLLPAISFVYFFGQQGVIKGLLFGNEIYGPIGIIMGEVFYTFPHALMILITALSTADGRLYEAALSLRASRMKIFFTVTLPGIKYGLISAIFVVFTLVITDFGIPKVIGGQFNVLATDIYKQVIGQQNFEMGAVVSVVLLIPAILAFIVDRIVQRKQVALLTARAVPYEAKPARAFDTFMFVYCAFIGFLIVSILGMAIYASFVTFWPYNMAFSLTNYDFDVMDGGGWDSFSNSITMALYTAVIGTTIIFTGAYMVEKAKGFGAVRGSIQFLCILPMAVPGMVLGLAYIFFFNHPDNPLNFIYGTMAILVICTISHFYTVSHMTAMTALKQMDPEFEAVSASLKVPFFKTFIQVTVPVCLPAILDISIYLFVNAMTTVSAVIFLYSTETNLASVAALNMDDAGDVAPAAAMCVMIVFVSATVRIFHAIFTRGMARRSQLWRQR